MHDECWALRGTAPAAVSTQDDALRMSPQPPLRMPPGLGIDEDLPPGLALGSKGFGGICGGMPQLGAAEGYSLSVAHPPIQKSRSQYMASQQQHDLSIWSPVPPPIAPPAKAMSRQPSDVSAEPHQSMLFNSASARSNCFVPQSLSDRPAANHPATAQSVDLLAQDFSHTLNLHQNAVPTSTNSSSYFKPNPSVLVAGSSAGSTPSPSPDVSNQFIGHATSGGLHLLSGVNSPPQPAPRGGVAGQLPASVTATSSLSGCSSQAHAGTSAMLPPVGSCNPSSAESSFDSSAVLAQAQQMQMAMQAPAQQLATQIMGGYPNRMGGSGLNSGINSGINSVINSGTSSPNPALFADGHRLQGHGLHGLQAQLQAQQLHSQQMQMQAQLQGQMQGQMHGGIFAHGLHSVAASPNLTAMLLAQQLLQGSASAPNSGANSPSQLAAMLSMMQPPIGMNSQTLQLLQQIQAQLQQQQLLALLGSAGTSVATSGAATPSGAEYRGRRSGSQTPIGEWREGHHRPREREGHSGRPVGHEPADSRECRLDIEKVISGADVRTTLMIRNIPNKYKHPRMVLEIIDSKHKGKYDLFYLPIDFRTNCNVGYAFINFIHSADIPSFYDEFNGKRWDHFNSEKICELKYARIQGKHGLLEHFSKTSLMHESESLQPVVFASDGSGAREDWVRPRRRETHDANAPPFSR